MLDKDKTAHPSELEDANFRGDLHQAVQAQTNWTTDAMTADQDDPSVDKEEADAEPADNQLDMAEADNASIEWNSDGQSCDIRQTKQFLKQQPS